MRVSPDMSLPDKQSDLDLPPGIWRLSLDVPAGDWSACRVYAGDRPLARFVSAQDLLVWCLSRTHLTLRTMAGSTALPNVSRARAGSSEFVAAFARRTGQSPRASLLAAMGQMSGGLLAIPKERESWPEIAPPPNDVVFELAAGIELVEAAAGRIASLFRDPAIRFVSWDIAGEGDGILPAPSRYLHRNLPYTWRASAHRRGEAHLLPEDLEPHAWCHLHESLARRTGPVPPCPTGKAAKQAMADPACSVIIPTRDSPDLVRACLEGLERSVPAPAQLVLVDHCTVDAEALSLLDAAEAAGAVRLRADGPFNFSRLCNLGAGAATGEVLVFLNNDVVTQTPDWLAQLAHILTQPGVGVAGAELHYPDGRLQHAGIVNSLQNGPQHVAAGQTSRDRGPLGLLNYARECLAVSGACFATRRGLFDQLGGFDEAYPEDYNDVDYCLRVREAGYLTLMAPSARLIHHESRTRDTQKAQSRERRLDFLARLRDRHPLLAEPDPYFSPRWETAPPLYRPTWWGHGDRSP